MFATQEPQREQITEGGVDRSNSFSMGKVWHIFQYMVLFDWNEDRSPFSVSPRSMFTMKEISDDWLEQILDNPSRMKCLSTLQALPEKKLSLFAKLEEGIS